MPAALLRQRCALTAPFHPYPAHSRKRTWCQEALSRMGGAVCFLWHFPSRISHSCAKNAQEWDTPSRTLSGTLLCGVRTFLPAHSCQNGRGDRPVRLPTTSLYAMVVIYDDRRSDFCGWRRQSKNYWREVGGRSEFEMSKSTFQAPVACFFQIIRYLPLSKKSLPRGGRKLIS